MAVSQGAEVGLCVCRSSCFCSGLVESISWRLCKYAKAHATFIHNLYIPRPLCIYITVCVIVSSIIFLFCHLFATSPPLLLYFYILMRDPFFSFSPAHMWNTSEIVFDEWLSTHHNFFFSFFFFQTPSHPLPTGVEDCRSEINYLCSRYLAGKWSTASVPRAT